MNALLRGFQRGPASAPGGTVNSVSRTHTGRVRTFNEDRVLDRGDLRLWAVADGMGGHSRGDVAADAAIAALASLAAPITAVAVDAALTLAHGRVHQQLHGQSGTTVVVLSIDGSSATIRWAGDSRAYLIRDERLSLLTRDHSVVQELLDAGLLDPAQAAAHPQANVITRALGIDADLQLETCSIALTAGDRLLLCSDGLSRTLDARDISGIHSLAALADRLLTNSLQRDGSDNASLVLVEI